MQHQVISTTTPHLVALRAMGRTATEASRVWAIRELAARLATRAGPRDYREQLEKIYEWIVTHWRYVMEPEEFVHGTASSLIKYVAGSKYNAPQQNPAQVDLDATPVREFGWGDCDDVATLTAALAMAIGFKALFRIAEAPQGAHVSVVVRIPPGRMISVDPVGYPKRPFGWKQPAPSVSFYNIETGQMTR